MSVRPMRRRELLGILSSLALQSNEDVVPFIDYTPRVFHREADRKPGDQML